MAAVVLVSLCPFSFLQGLLGLCMYNTSTNTHAGASHQQQIMMKRVDAITRLTIRFTVSTLSETKWKEEVRTVEKACKHVDIDSVCVGEHQYLSYYSSYKVSFVSDVPSFSSFPPHPLSIGHPFCRWQNSLASASSQLFLPQMHFSADILFA